MLSYCRSLPTSSRRVVAALSATSLAWVATSCSALQAPEDSARVYLTERQALDVVFPDAVDVKPLSIELSESERAAVSERVGRRVLQPAYRAFVGVRGDGSVDGFAVIQDEIGKFRPFRFKSSESSRPASCVASP